MNNGTVTNQNDSGILIERGSIGDNAFIGWDESVDKFIMGTTTATSSSTGDINVNLGTLQANLTGDTINTTSNATIGGTLDVTGDTSVSTLDTTGSTSLATGGGVVNISKTGVMTTVKGTLNAKEAVTLDI